MTSQLRCKWTTSEQGHLNAVSAIRRVHANSGAELMRNDHVIHRPVPHRPQPPAAQPAPILGHSFSGVALPPGFHPSTTLFHLVAAREIHPDAVRAELYRIGAQLDMRGGWIRPRPPVPPPDRAQGLHLLGDVAMQASSGNAPPLGMTGGAGRKRKRPECEAPERRMVEDWKLKAAAVSLATKLREECPTNEKAGDVLYEALRKLKPHYREQPTQPSASVQ